MGTQGTSPLLLSSYSNHTVESDDLTRQKIATPPSFLIIQLDPRDLDRILELLYKLILQLFILLICTRCTIFIRGGMLYGSILNATFNEDRDHDTNVISWNSSHDMHTDLPELKEIRLTKPEMNEIVPFAPSHKL